MKPIFPFPLLLPEEDVKTLDFMKKIWKTFRSRKFDLEIKFFSLALPKFAKKNEGGGNFVTYISHIITRFLKIMVKKSCTHPLRTPSTRFNIKKDPTTMRGIKKTQLATLPTASFVWKRGKKCQWR